jgi:hypothetical protein
VTPGVTRFVAAVARIDEDYQGGFVTAGFAEHADGTGDVLLVQRRTGPPDPQDVELGLDSYCLISGDAVHYGGVTGLAFTDRTVRFTVTTAAQEALGWPHPVVEVTVRPADLPALRRSRPDLLS